MNFIAKLIISCAILLGMIASLAAFNLLKKDPPEKPVSSSTPLVSVFNATPFDGELDLTFTGEVVPYRVVTKSTEVSGRIKTKSDKCRPGRTVSINEPLIEIDVIDYEIEIKRLNSEVAQAQAMLDELADEIKGAEKNVEVAQREYDLLQGEWERRKEIAGSLSKSDLTSAERNAITAQKALISQQNSLKLLKTRKTRLTEAKTLSNTMLEKATLDKERGSIRAPISGVIVESNVEQEDYVNKGTAVFTIEDTSQAEVLCNLKLNQLDWLWENRPPALSKSKRTAYQPPQVPVEITGLIGEQAVTWHGRLDRYDGIGLDESTKSVPCRIVVDNPIASTEIGPVAMVRGIFVEARVKYERKPNDSKSSKLTSFPAGAIQPGDYVWVVVDKKLVKRDVNLVDTVFDDSSKKRMAVVSSTDENSVQPGDQVVDSPINAPTEGATVRINTETENKDSSQSDSKLKDKANEDNIPGK